MFPEERKISRSLRKVLRKREFEIRFDSSFENVIKACADVRTEQGKGTWIIPEMQKAYTELHQEGYAHSVESWLNGELVGGLYGISLGQCFLGNQCSVQLTILLKLHWSHLQNFQSRWE